MTDYIKREDAIFIALQQPFFQNSMATEIRQLPGINLVMCSECKNCKKKRGTFRGEPIIFYRCTEHNRDVESDDYCSWAEREGE